MNGNVELLNSAYPTGLRLLRFEENIIQQLKAFL